MKYLSLVLVLCGVASFAAAPAHAFDIEGENASLQDGVEPRSSPGPTNSSTRTMSKGSSLALPYIGKDDSDYISDYGNAIPIPGPGIDQALPGLGLLAPLLATARGKTGRRFNRLLCNEPGGAPSLSAARTVAMFAGRAI